MGIVRHLDMSRQCDGCGDHGWHLPLAALQKHCEDDGLQLPATTQTKVGSMSRRLLFGRRQRPGPGLQARSPQLLIARQLRPAPRLHSSAPLHVDGLHMLMLVQVKRPLTLVAGVHPWRITLFGPL